MTPLLLLRTGGTMDAAPYDDPRRPPSLVCVLPRGESLVPAAVASLLPHGTVEERFWNEDEERRFVKDSQLFTEDDMQALAALILRHPQRYVLITHGTDAMARNAAWLRKALKKHDKTVIFVGAMVPLSMQEKSDDGLAALRFALEHLAHQPPGVWVMGRDAAGNQALFDPETVEKDRGLSLERLSLTFKKHPSGAGSPELR